MTEDLIHDVVAISGAAALIGGLILMILIISVFFKKIEKVEKQIATPGKQLDGIKRVWGNGPIGRWMRATHVWCFFIFRHTPRYGPTIARRMGDEVEPVPIKSKLWAVIPVSSVFVLAFLFLVTSWYLGAFD